MGNYYKQISLKSSEWTVAAARLSRLTLPQVYRDIVAR